MKRIRWLSGAAIVTLACGAQAADVIGRVLVAVGDVTAVRAGREIRLQTASPIEAGDSVRTAAASNAQIRLTDESIIALRPETEFAFADYRYTGKEDGSERAFFRLLKGGLRTITGVVGRRNNQNYQVETAAAGIGIRGTHYVLLLCQQSCFNADGSRAPDGLYGNASGLSFGTNRVSATNNTGEKVFGVNEPFRVADLNTEPQRLIAPPDFLGDTLAGRDRNPDQGRVQAGTQKAAADASPDGRSITPPPPPEALPAIATEQRDPAGQLAVLSASTIPSVGNGSIAYFCASAASCAQRMASASLSADAQGQQLIAFSDGSISGMRGPAGAMDVGSHAAAGNLHWGVWPNAIVNGASIAFLHYIVGDVPSLPGTGVFTYSPVGGTRPTNSAGLTGMFLAGTVTVDFGLRNLQLNNWQITFDGATYLSSGGGSASFAQSSSFAGAMNWSCTGTTCATASAGDFAGSFAGAGAPGMGIVYRAPGASGDIIGAQGFKR